jgi:hypothetical protein
MSGIKHTCRSETKKQDDKLEKLYSKNYVAPKENLKVFRKPQKKTRFFSERKAQPKNFV